MGLRGILAWLLSAVFSIGGGTAAPAAGPVSRPDVPFLIANVEHLQHIPDTGGISASFDPNRPYMYVSTLHGLSVYEIGKPEWPTLVSVLPMAIFQNENVNLGPAASRADGSSFVMVATDLFGAITPTDLDKTALEPGGGGYVQHIYVIDVTDPKNPFIRSDISPSTYTHTVSCVTDGCEYAYTAGTNEQFSIIDLRDLDKPKELKTVKDPWGWHDWQVDAAGVIWKSGDGGSAAYDISDPLNPRALNGTNKLGDAEAEGEWNRYIHHNSERPYAKRLPLGAKKRAGEPSVFHGDVLLVAEETELGGQCGDEMGRFQTWEVPSLRSGDIAGNKRGAGTMRPLESWRAEFADGIDIPRGFGCSAHYFDFHQSGFVAQGWYDYGVRILDVRDARNIKQVGYFMVPWQETWATYWVPTYGRDGKIVTGPEGTALDTNIVYSIDAVRGLDVLRVKLPKTSSAATKSVASPGVPSWLKQVPAEPKATVSSPYFSCRIR